MMSMMKPANGASTTNGTSRILDAPISLGSIGGARNTDVGLDSIWINKKEDELVTLVIIFGLKGFGVCSKPFSYRKL